MMILNSHAGTCVKKEEKIIPLQQLVILQFIIIVIQVFCFIFKLQSPCRQKGTSSNIYIAPPPLVFKVETGFQPVAFQQTVNISVKNYDGSQTHQTISKDGQFETVTEVTLGEAGQVLSKTSRRGTVHQIYFWHN